MPRSGEKRLPESRKTNLVKDEPQRYPIPARTHQVEQVIRKSRFITLGDHAPDAEAAHAFVASVRARFPDATHHCWAFVAGPPESTGSVGMSDDGEPHGTAGRPMLTTLLHGGVGEIVVVCVRYFGGTKLGTGGLSRAYSGGVRFLLESLPTQEKVDRVSMEVVLDYGAAESFVRLLESVEATVEREEYREVVTFRIAVPKVRAPELVEAVAQLTRGKGLVRPAD